MGKVLELRRITKKYASVIANNEVSIEVEAGEIRAIIGENGAGKTTLAEIIYGLRRPDSGEIVINGKGRNHLTPKEAISLGIGLIRQERMLIPGMSVLENIVLGAEPVKRGGEIDWRDAKKRVKELLPLLGFSLDLAKPISSLTPGEKQLVELIKLLFRGASLLILDEPTSHLTPNEVSSFLSLIKRLKEEGKTVLFISHRLPEVLAVASRITVMRRGKVVGTISREEADEENLSHMMMGESFLPPLEKEEVTPGKVVLKLSGVTVTAEDGRLLLDNISLTLREGEIVGIASVAGNGERELALSIAGFLKPKAGEIEIANRQANFLPPEEIKRLGVAFIPGERDEEGLILDFTLAENLILGYHRLPPYYRFPLLSIRKASQQLLDLSSRLGIVPLDLSLPLNLFSGGNRERVIIARELFHDPCLIIAENPTQGLDIAGARLVRNLLLAEQKRGAGILLISPEVEELIALSDRIVVLRRGRIVSELKPREATPKLLGRLMTGGGG